jgi:TRAP-type C4-dicarboxylate transport system permease small subunit
VAKGKKRKGPKSVPPAANGEGRADEGSRDDAAADEPTEGQAASARDNERDDDELGGADAREAPPDVPSAPVLDGEKVGLDDERGRDDQRAARGKVDEAPQGARWGEPIARFERGWTWLEQRLLVFVLLSLVLLLISWVFLGGLAAPYLELKPDMPESAIEATKNTNRGGLVFRSVLAASLLALIAHFSTRKQPEKVHTGAVLVALVAGVAVGPLLRKNGIEYFDNIKLWMQEGSLLALFGGPRGLGTRLTLWLALLGASIATSAGKHIHIDIVFRLLPKSLRLPAALTTSLAVVAMCTSGAWGFFDHIAIESLRRAGRREAGRRRSTRWPTERWASTSFLVRKQVSLDLKSLPHILKGDRFDRWMGAAEWNAWVKDADFESRYPKEAVESVLVPDDAPPHTPLVVAPDGESTRGILVHALSLVFPFGMLVLALRFLLRILLSLSGHIEVDPDAAHKEEIGHHGPTATEPEKGGV